MSALRQAPGRRIVVRRRPRITLPAHLARQEAVDIGQLADPPYAALPDVVAAAPDQAPRPVPGATTALDPVAISSTGKDFDVDLLAGGRVRQRPVLVKVGNLSPFVCVVTLNGQQDHLRAWETNVFSANGAASMHVHPIPVLVSNQTPGNYYLFATVAPAGVDIPGTYPIMNTHQQQASSPQTLVPGFPITLSQDGLTHDLGVFTVPSNTHAIGFLFSAAGIDFINVLGVASGADYADQTIVNPPVSTALVKFFPAVDSAVHILATTTSGAGSCTISAVFEPNSQLVSIDPDQAGPGTPALWQAPRSFARFAGSVAANATATIVAGVNGQSVYLFGGVCSTDTAISSNDLSFQTSVGNGIFDFGASASPLPFQFNGLSFVSGQGLRVLNADTVAHTIRVGFGYNQG